MDLRAVLKSHLGDARAGWSMGTFGALAEFHYDPDEQLVRDELEHLVRATARGAIRVELPEEVSVVAYETLSASPHRWSHGIALCLPEGEAHMSERRTVTELGPDAQAIRDEDRDAILFDMGLSVTGPGGRQVDFCVRTADPKLIDVLRVAEGQSIFDPSCPAMGSILGAHPNRVALTRLGRVEVYQPIGGPATGGISPAGPHTHLLPKLLASGRTHAANIPIPDGLVPCAWLYPADPVSTAMGPGKPFDAALYEAFERLLDAWGIPTYVETKKQVREGIAARREPASINASGSRLERTAVRIALRQLARGAETPEMQSLIQDWRDAYDTATVQNDPLEAEHGNPLLPQ